MMYVKAINWIDQSAEEAELTITDGVYECIAFCHPCELSIGSVLKEPLYGSSCKDLLISFEKVFQLKQTKPNGFEHVGVGKVINLDKGLISIGDIIIEIRFLPGDVKLYDYIQFKCARIDALR